MGQIMLYPVRRVERVRPRSSERSNCLPLSWWRRSQRIKSSRASSSAEGWSVDLLHLVIASLISSFGLLLVAGIVCRQYEHRVFIHVYYIWWQHHASTCCRCCCWRCWLSYLFPNCSVFQKMGQFFFLLISFEFCPLPYGMVVRGRNSRLPCGPARYIMGYLTEYRMKILFLCYPVDKE